jgi:hypothetical protein
MIQSTVFVQGGEGVEGIQQSVFGAFFSVRGFMFDKQNIHVQSNIFIFLTNDIGEL